MAEVRNKRIAPEEFEQMRKEVLSAWPTGKEVDLQEAMGYLKSLPREKVAANVIDDAERQDRILLSTQAGRATIEENLKLYQLLQEAGVDLLPVGIDSHTRSGEFKQAEVSLAESEKRGRNLMNGVPVVAYGVKKCRLLTEAVNKPLVIKTAANDVRLLSEIGLAGGFTSADGDALLGFTQYNRITPLSEIIRNYQYVDRLVAIYNENGIPILREHPVSAGGVIVPPSLVIVQRIVDSLISAEQGVRYLLHDFKSQCNIMESVATIKVESKLMREYLDRFGYHSIRIISEIAASTVHYPKDQITTAGLLAMVAIMAAGAGVRVFHCQKSIAEASGLPTPESTAATMREIRALLDVLRYQRYPEGDELKLEMDFMEKECRQILERMLEFGDGDIAIGASKSFETGAMDMCFTANALIKNKIMAAKDRTGAARFLDFGNLPFTSDVKEWHRQKLAERGRGEGREIGINAALEDIAAGLLAKA
ncbi:MAG: hypothetical protein HYX79_06690 [Chloroflexi bacterium]|nr:hypothetical protein [Chloroflexota bacterium]